MDLAQSFDDVLAIARRSPTPSDGLRELAKYLDSNGQKLSTLRAVDIEDDVREVRRQLTNLLKSDPPPPGIDALYFGLFDTLSRAGEPAIGYYVAGVRGFRAEDADSLVGPAWFPDRRFLSSRTLDQLKLAEVEATVHGDLEFGELLSYAGQFGVALLVSRFASANLVCGAKCVVGFDSGDFTTIDS